LVFLLVLIQTEFQDTKTTKKTRMKTKRKRRRINAR